MSYTIFRIFQNNSEFLSADLINVRGVGFEAREGDIYENLKCSYFGDNVFYGHENFDNWPLRGDGETYPFDTYVLRGFISRQFYFVENQTATILYPNATINEDYVSPIIELQKPDSEFVNGQFMIRLERESSLQAAQLMVPVMFSFFVLGVSVLVERKKISERLSVYIALFFFAPTFLLAIQSFLPSRSSFAIPEILIISNLAATAFLAISTMIPVQKTGKKLDTIVIILSMILLVLLYYPVLALQVSIATIAILVLAETGVASGIIIQRLMSLKVKDKKERKKML